MTARESSPAGGTEGLRGPQGTAGGETEANVIREEDAANVAPEREVPTLVSVDGRVLVRVAGGELVLLGEWLAQRGKGPGSRLITGGPAGVRR